MSDTKIAELAKEAVLAQECLDHQSASFLRIGIITRTSDRHGNPVGPVKEVEILLRDGDRELNFTTNAAGACRFAEDLLRYAREISERTEIRKTKDGHDIEIVTEVG